MLAGRGDEAQQGEVLAPFEEDDQGWEEREHADRGDDHPVAGDEAELAEPAEAGEDEGVEGHRGGAGREGGRGAGLLEAIAQGQQPHVPVLLLEVARQQVDADLEAEAEEDAVRNPESMLRCPMAK